MKKLPIHQEAKKLELEFHTRRHFLQQCRTGMGMLALGSLLDGCNFFGGDMGTHSISLLI